MMTAKQIETNPFLAEIKKHVAMNGLSVSEFRDECTYIRDILSAVAYDSYIPGASPAGVRADRESVMYGALIVVMQSFATPGDVFDAIEAFDFIIELTGP